MQGASAALRSDDWAERSEHWRATSPKAAYRPKRKRPTAPLVLCGHGVSLRVERDSLVISDGLTHYPQTRATSRFFRGDPELPPRIVVLDGSGSISFAVLSWLANEAVPLIRIDWRGDVATVIGGPGSAYLPQRVAWQIGTRDDPQLRTSFCCDLIIQKLRASIWTLSSALPPTPERERALATADAAIQQLGRREVRSINDILMIEARSAAAYFAAWRGLPIRWKSRSRFPVPETWLTADARRSNSPKRAATNRHATHPLNAMLNYGYAVLHSEARIAAVTLGFDPARGILHESRADASALILDLMEPHRPVVDAAVLAFVARHTFSGADFVIRSDGACRLGPQLSKALCAHVAGSLELPLKLLQECGSGEELGRSL